MRNALRDAELPPPAGGWERLERELGGAAPGPGASETAAPRGSVWRIYWPRIAAAAAVVLIGIVAGDLLLRPDTVLKQEGVVITTADGGKTAEPLLPGSGGEAAGPVLAQAVPPASAASSARRRQGKVSRSGSEKVRGGLFKRSSGGAGFSPRSG